MAGCEITSVHYRTLLQRVREAGYTHRLFSQGEPEPGVRTSMLATANPRRSKAVASSIVFFVVVFIFVVSVAGFRPAL